MKTTALCAAACLLMAAPAFAQSSLNPGTDTKAPANNAGSSRAPSGSTTTGMASAPAAAEFARKVAISDMFEIQSSQLAQEKADANSKPFAAKMVKDHSQTTAQLKQLVSQGKVNVQLPTSLDSEHQKKLDDLKAKSGSEFDEAYDNAQREAHQQAVMLFEQYAQNGDNPDLKSWAQKTLPHLKEHLSSAEKLK